MKLARPAITASIPCWIKASVGVSTELVASSMMKMSGSARAIRSAATAVPCSKP